MANNISIQLNEKEFAKLIRKTVGTRHKQFADCIISHYESLSSTHAPILAMAAIGITPEFDHKIGDRVLVQDYGVDTYEIDQYASLDKGFVIKDDDFSNVVVARVTSIAPYKVKPIELSYQFCKTDGTIAEKKDFSIASYIKPYPEVFPGDSEAEIAQDEPVI